MKTTILIATLWRCFAIDTSAGYLYSAVHEDRATAKKWAMQRCVLHASPGEFDSCFEDGCRKIESPLGEADL